MVSTKEEKCTTEIYKVLYKHKITLGNIICILEVMKQDFILNTGLVKIDGVLGQIKTKRKK